MKTTWDHSQSMHAGGYISQKWKKGFNWQGNYCVQDTQFFWSWSSSAYICQSLLQELNIVRYIQVLVGALWQLINLWPYLTWYICNWQKRYKSIQACFAGTDKLHHCSDNWKANFKLPLMDFLDYTTFAFSWALSTFFGSGISGMFHPRESGCNRHAPAYAEIAT